MQRLADMKPAFLRFPGGNYVEGRTIATRFDWKRRSAIFRNGRAT
jgi:alpha-N-arabinofuranosidase